MQIFIHELVVDGVLRETDADMQQHASEVAMMLSGISGLAFSGARILIERVDGQDQGLFVIEGALYGGKDMVHVEAQVKYEDGRTGSISADPKIRDAKTFAPGAARKAA